MSQQHLHVNIQGMTCQSCASRLEKVLNKREGVQNVSVNFAGETAQMDYDDSQIQVDELIAIIEKTGFQAAITKSRLPENPFSSMHGRINWRVCLLMMLALPFMMGMVGMMFGSHALMPPVWFQAALATVVQLWLAIPFYRSALASLRGGLANMDVLVSMGTLVIYVYSMVMAWMAYDEHIYFEAGVMVIAFVSLGKHWEEKTKRGSLNGLSLMMQLTPSQVQVWRAASWQTVSLDSVQIGDTLRCVAGGRIAADGTVLSGEAWADESHLTGESLPVHKTTGSKVLAGSLLSGSLEYQAEALGSDTVLGDMMSALAEAQGSKAPIARLADQVAAVFVPVVLGIAACTLVLTGLFSGSLTQAVVHAVAVLVVACPCALGLATPAAIMAGMGVAVQHGVWFKNATVLEQAGKLDVLVLDKTGTLTQGRPEVSAVWLAPDCSETRLFQAAAAVECHSNHPLAQALVSHIQNKGIDILLAHNVQTEVGAGLSAQVEGIGRVQVGKTEYCGFRLPESQDGVWQCASVVAVAINGSAAGAFALTDILKPDSPVAIAKLRAQNMMLYLLSGDRLTAVTHTAMQLNIAPEHALAQQSPRDKAEWIATLKQQGAKVGMLGDGINDAPALAVADVGFAIKGSTDVAEHSADVVLMNASPMQLVKSISIARATLRTIKQNLFFAFIYNIIGIPLAAFGLLTPMMAGVMMALSSISVLGNALRLRKHPVS